MGTAPRVVVTGMGAVASLGDDCGEIFGNLICGRSGVDRITQFDASNNRCRIAGEARTFDPLRYMDRKLAKRVGRYAQFALAASQQALAQSALDLAAEDPERIATIIGTAIGDFAILEEQLWQYAQVGYNRINPFTVPRVSTNMAAAHVAMQYGFSGPSYGCASACATGSHALANAWMVLRSGLADVALSGGVEAAITESFLESYVAMGALSLRNDEPQRASRPFDKGRDGFVLGEGGAVLLLETEEHALARGATILAELAGAGLSADAYHMTAAHPEGRGARQAMERAMRAGGIAPDEVGYINAHGTATQINDAIETIAIRNTFGERAYEIPVSSVKSMLGHSIGGAGALEAMVSVMTICRGVIPPTINLEEPDEACDLDYVPQYARHENVDVVLSNSFAFGGHNAVLAFRRYRPLA